MSGAHCKGELGKVRFKSSVTSGSTGESTMHINLSSMTDTRLENPHFQGGVVPPSLFYSFIRAFPVWLNFKTTRVELRVQNTPAANKKRIHSLQTKQKCKVFLKTAHWNGVAVHCLTTCLRQNIFARAVSLAQSLVCFVSHSYPLFAKHSDLHKLNYFLWWVCRI